MSQFVKSFNQVLKDPIVYHVGAVHLTNNKPNVSTDVPEEVIEALSAYVHAACPNTTITKSKAATPVDLVRGHPWYIRINQVKMAMAHDVTLSEEEIKELVQQEIGGTTLAEVATHALFPSQVAEGNKGNIAVSGSI